MILRGRRGFQWMWLWTIAPILLIGMQAQRVEIDWNAPAKPKWPVTYIPAKEMIFKSPGQSYSVILSHMVYNSLAPGYGNDECGDCMWADLMIRNEKSGEQKYFDRAKSPRGAKDGGPVFFPEAAPFTWSPDGKYFALYRCGYGDSQGEQQGCEHLIIDITIPRYVVFWRNAAGEPVNLIGEPWIPDKPHSLPARRDKDGTPTEAIPEFEGGIMKQVLGH